MSFTLPFQVDPGTVAMALDRARKVKLTMPWFAHTSAFAPQPHTVIHPLINGERAFAAVEEALAAATQSIDIISWGFDPSMCLTRPGGRRLGDILHAKAKAGVRIRVLIWKDLIAQFFENNMPGNGLLGRGGGSAGLGSGIGSTSAGATGSAGKDEYNDYGGGSRPSNSGALERGDDEMRAYNRNWYKTFVNNLVLRTRSIGFIEGSGLGRDFRRRYGIKPAQAAGLSIFPSHHQKMILTDYALPDRATGFVMGHNLLRNYWDTDDHPVESSLRDGFKPWHDLSTRVYGPILNDLKQTFEDAWEKAETLWNASQWIAEPPAAKPLAAEVFAKPALTRGKGEMAQICRTLGTEERSIRDLYYLTLADARVYVYFENQYFRYKPLAMHLRAIRRALKGAGWPRDFYVFVVTNVPDGHGRVNTYEMLQALGKSTAMPHFHKKNAKGDEDKLVKADLDGVHIHVCSLATSGKTEQGMQYRPIYVHSKLMLIDDVFFTVGSANVNVRSMEVDTELNIACTSPTLTKEWREKLWKLHTSRMPTGNMAAEFRAWDKIMKDNTDRKERKLPLVAPLIEFFDDASTGGRAD